MSFRYRQSTGEFSCDGKSLVFGYSGHGDGRNCPEKQEIVKVGPIPRGLWGVEGPPYDHPDHGPYVLRLVAAPGTNLFGRSGFLIHGDSIKHPGEASEGCIILPRQIREEIWAHVLSTGNRFLEVVA